MLEDADEGGVRLWHLVKASEEPELPKHRRGSLRERERAKAIPEIYLTRLLSMKVQHTHLGLVPLSRGCRKEMRSTGVPHFLKICFLNYTQLFSSFVSYNVTKLNRHTHIFF